MLDPGTPVELQVLVDLALLLAGRGLVDGQLDPALAVPHDLRHERRVLAGDLVVTKVDQLGEPHDVVVVLRPLVHLPQLHVAHHVVDQLDPHRRPLVDDRFLGAIAREEWARVVLPLDERMQGVAVRGDGRVHHLAVLVLEHGGLQDGPRSALGGLLPGIGGIGDPEGHVLHPIPVLAHVFGDHPLRAHRPGEHVAGLALFDHPRGAVAQLRLWTGVRGDVEAERLRVVEGGLSRVAHVVLDMVDPDERHEVLVRVRGGPARRLIRGGDGLIHGHRRSLCRGRLDYTRDGNGTRWRGRYWGPGGGSKGEPRVTRSRPEEIAPARRSRSAARRRGLTGAKRSSSASMTAQNEARPAWLHGTHRSAWGVQGTRIRQTAAIAAKNAGRLPIRPIRRGVIRTLGRVRRRARRSGMHPEW